MRKSIIFILSSVIMGIGGCGGPLVLRLYFLYGGKSHWLPAFLQTCGWPFTLIGLVVSYFYQRKAEGPNAKLIFMKVPMLASTVFLGVLVGLAAFSYAIGEEYLPVSTVTIIYSTQLAFTGVFAFFILKQKFTIFTVASVVLLVAGGATLALDAGGGKSSGETNLQYALGFILTFISAACVGLATPLIQLVYMKSNTEMCYTLVMEMQMMISFFASFFAFIAMLITNGFKAISREARTFELGEAKYYLVIISVAIAFEFILLGTVGVVFSTSALLAGILTSLCVPVAEVLAVICLHENFNIGKGVSLVLCLLGFALYYYGEIRQTKKSNLTKEDATQLLLHDAVISES